ADSLYAMSISYEWLLGARACDQARILAVCIRKLAPEEQRPGGPASWDPTAINDVSRLYVEAYQQLQSEIRKHLHLEPLEVLFPGITPVKQDERVMLQTQVVSKPPVNPHAQ